MQETIYPDTDSCCQALAKDMAAQLSMALGKTKGKVSFAVSGGRTPRKVFEALSKTDIDWPRVVVTLTDERWVAADDVDSNERLVRRFLIKGYAVKVPFIAFKTNDRTAEQGAEQVHRSLQKIPWPLDVIYLGMGADGHIASLFTEQNRANSELTVVSAEALNSPKERLSLSLDAIKSAHVIYLQLSGLEKIRTFQNAKDNKFAPSSAVQALIKTSADKCRVFISNS